MNNTDYIYDDIVDAIKRVGVVKDDVLFSHSNIGFFGKLYDAKTTNDYCHAFMKAIFEIIGINGTLVVPTFSYSFCNNQNFDKDETPSVCGAFSEYIRKHKDAKRSNEPNFSISAIGKYAENFTKEQPSHPFGKNSFWERFLMKNGKFLNLNFDSGSTFFHFVEKSINVPYRFDKKFVGKLKSNSEFVEKEFLHFVYDKNKVENRPNFEKFHKKALMMKMTKTSNLGKGQIVCISSQNTMELIKKEIKNDSNFLIQKL